MKNENEEINETAELTERTIEHADVLRVLNFGTPRSVQQIAADLGTMDYLAVKRLIDSLRNDGEVTREFGSDDIAVYRLSAGTEKPESSKPISNFKSLSYAEVAARIITAITDRHCTLGQIRKHAGFAQGDDFSEVLDGLFYDKKIEKHTNGEFTAFFLEGQVPQKWHVEGGITVFDETEPSISEARKRELIAQKQAERDAADEAKREADARAREIFDIKSKEPKPAQPLEETKTADEIEDPDRDVVDFDETALDVLEDLSEEMLEMVDEVVEAVPTPTQQPGRTRGRNRKIKLDPVEIERLAEEMRTGDEVAQVLGYAKLSGLHTAMKKDPSLREAYDRGRSRRPKLQRLPVTTRETRNIDLTPELVETTAAEYGSKRQVALALGYADASGFRDRLKANPVFTSAYERGKARFDELQNSRPQTPENVALDNEIAPTPEPIDTIAETANAGNETANVETVAEAMEADHAEVLTKPIEGSATGTLFAGPNDVMPETHFSPMQEPAAGTDAWIKQWRERNEEALSQSRTQANPLDPKEPHVSKEWITLANGSQIMFAFEGDIFTLSRSDKALVDLIYKIAKGYPSKFEVAGDDSKVKLNLPGSEPELKHRDGLWTRIRRAISRVGD